MYRVLMCANAILPAAAGFGQHLTIQVEDANPKDVVTAIQHMTGAQIIGHHAVPDDTPLITLDHEDAPLKRVLRDICAQAGWHYRRFGQGYHLMPGVEEDHRPRVVMEGFEVTLEAVRIQNAAWLNLRETGREVQSDHSLSLTLKAESEEDEAVEVLVGFDTQVKVTYDTGEEVTGPEQRLHPRMYLHGGTLDGQVRLPPPPEGATKIASIEGDLVMFAQLERLELEFGVDEAGMVKDEGVLSVTLVGFNEEQTQATFELMMPTDEYKDEDGQTIQPRSHVTLIDDTGAQVRESGGGFSGRGPQDGVSTYEQTFHFGRKLEGTPMTLRYRTLLARDPSKRLPYKFEDIPLPLLTTE